MFKKVSLCDALKSGVVFRLFRCFGFEQISNFNVILSICAIDRTRNVLDQIKNESILKSIIIVYFNILILLDMMWMLYYMDMILIILI